MPSIKNLSAAVVLAGICACLGAPAFASEPNVNSSYASIRASQGGLIVTSTDGIEGFRITKYIGIVRGITVREPTIGQSFKANLKGIVGGKISPYMSMCETARTQAYDAMVARATEAGAQAIVSVRYDSSGFSSGGNDMSTEVFCYGTAVLIEPVPAK
ncbi:MAG TPA: YbjQ family protein [Drouetiella sp.]